MNNPSQRQLRVAEQIKEVLAESFLRGHFQSKELVLNAAAITVTEVRISPDLKHATAYVIAHGDNDIEVLLKALNDEAFGMQREINRQTQLKFTPKLQFRRDDIFDKTQRLDSIFSNLKYSDQGE
jgi:ribosome-binding factor A